MSPAHLEGMDVLGSLRVPTVAARDISHSMDPNSLTGLPARPALEHQAALVASVTCPACGRLSRYITHETARCEIGVMVGAVCVCPNGHTWPLIEVDDDE